MTLIDPGLLLIMACPFDRNDLLEDEAASRLVCSSCGRRFPVEDGIPRMRPEDAEPPAGGPRPDAPPEQSPAG
ncbi:MAG: Trm112 family protein [Acidimicrobiia bacterium]